MQHQDSGWEFRIDRGGTFTDVVARDPDGATHVRKLLSSCPERYADAPLHAIRQLLELGGQAPIPAEALAAVKMGTTLATNALLERRGAAVGLVVTRGFGDLLRIGYQDRPELFALRIRKPQPLARAVVEAQERILADGRVLHPLEEGALRSELKALRARGIDSLAVVLLHAYAHPEHELQAGALARELGFEHVSLSHRVAGEIKAVSRGDTTVADAYLTPVIKGYVASARAQLGPHVSLRFMQSSGGLADAERFSGKDAVLSGPAGGAVACSAICRQAGFTKAIGFDMGGTSTDVSRFDGRFERVYERLVAGVRLKAPSIAIETVAAGGGSLLSYDGRRYAVGPSSAGADPGPACYRRGGPAALTDANLVLGRIQARWFPSCFGPNADQALDAASASARLDELARDERSPEQAAAGFLRIANQNMVTAIKDISVARGYDVREYALVCFGGAGGQHACAVAEELGIATVLIHPLASVLSAYGLGLADARFSAVRPVLQLLTPELRPQLERGFRKLEADGLRVLRAEGFSTERIEHRRSLELRYQGVDAGLALEPGPGLSERFETRHRALHGYADPGAALEVVNLRVDSVGLVPKPGVEPQSCRQTLLADRDAEERVKAFFEFRDADGRRSLQACDTPVFLRHQLEPGAMLRGPALIIEELSTTVVDPGWTARVDGLQNLVLELAGSRRGQERLAAACDPVQLEVFNNLFRSIADRMGHALERTAHSINIRERRDFSCAVFDGEGELVANAQHIPVHLGAMGESVRAILQARAHALRPGEVYLSNDPYHGGSHLPDITVVSPIFRDQARPVFFVANRGHHADIGGVVPGSMPPLARRLEEEGVVMHALRIVSQGVFDEEAVVAALQDAPWPARDIGERLSDLRAQVAANRSGQTMLAELCDKYGLDTVRAYTGHVRANAAAAMGELIAGLPDGVHRFEDRLDCGARIACALHVRGDRLRVDFSGTDKQLQGNLNAPPAVTLAAVLYVFRSLVGRDIPLNGGCLDPIELRIPRGSLLAPHPPAAVAGGNVETSMRVTDVLYGALGVMAAGQGTMNNFSFGAQGFGYYETIGGGSGAGPGFHGASAVHSAMTNTRITDPEVLERRHPVLLRRFALRRGSGGMGRWRGGDGALREVEFLRAMTVSMLSQRRSLRPWGMAGGGPGAAGRNLLLRRDGSTEELDGCFSLQVATGDALRIETPGGGGWGEEE